MTKNLTVASSPHIRGGKTTQKIMLDVIIAMLPVVVASGILFGLDSLIRVAFGAASCVLIEYFYCLLAKKPASTGDLSAVVTGMLLAFNVPAQLPLWQLFVGCLVAIVVVKQMFGGVGMNFVNPALAGRVVMGISFPGTMTAYTFPALTPDGMAGATPLLQLDAISKATPLAERWVGKYADLNALFFGNYGGVLGETCTIALVIGFIYLVARGIIKPIIPLCYVGTTFVFHWLYGAVSPLHAILSGGLLLGAIFMATDYTTTPYTNWGKVIFGVGCGILTATIRTFASTSEGVTYAILIMNLLVSYINDFTRRKPYGGAVK